MDEIFEVERLCALRDAASGSADGTGATDGACDCEAQPAVATIPTTAAQAETHCLIMVVNISRARRFPLGR